ncbi:hypothetical protein ISS85_03150 [Candidatus Microgenomates bacterium]|nr:hypothetical protein [Candidatus Microgenomates bacterium]
MTFSKSKQNFWQKIGRLRKKIGAFEILIGFLILMGLGWVMVKTKSKENWARTEVRVVSTSTGWTYAGQAPPYWVSESFKVQDKEFDSSGKLIAEVLKIKKLEFGGESKDVYLTFNLKVSKNRKTSKLEFKNKPLEIGGPIELHLSNTYVYGLVTFVEGLKDERKEKEFVVKAIWMNTFPCQAEAIPVGGKMENGPGEVIAEILDKKIELAEIVVTTDRGEVLARKNPTRRDVTLKIKIKVKEQGGVWYFYEHKKVKVGEGISLYLPGIDFHPMIKEIFDLEGNKIY